MGGAVEGVDEGADDGIGCGGRGLGRDRDPLPPGGGCGGCADGHDPGCGGRQTEERGQGARLGGGGEHRAVVVSRAEIPRDIGVNIAGIRGESGVGIDGLDAPAEGA